MDDLPHMTLFLQSLAIGLLIGVERERHPEAKGGLRTFALIALSGTLFAGIGATIGAPWLIAVPLVLVGAMMIAAYAHDAGPAADPGTTTVIAAMLTCGLGAMVWYGYSTLAIALAVAIMALLYFRAELHGVSQRLSRRDYVSFLQFAALAFVLLPVLPDRTIDPFQVLNPLRIGWIVVLISGVSLAGYVALRVLDNRRGMLVAGVFGGLASTTATTLVFARHAREGAAPTPLAIGVILIANLVLYLRVALFTLLIAPAVFKTAAPVLAGGLFTGGVFTLWYVYRHRGATTAGPLRFDISNPAELRLALGFALLYAVVLEVVALMNNLVGVMGVYAVAFLSGLTDLDAISLSTLRMTNSGNIAAIQAVLAISIAFIANFIFKLGAAATSGTRPLAIMVGTGFAVMTAGMVAGYGIVLWF